MESSKIGPNQVKSRQEFLSSPPVRIPLLDELSDTYPIGNTDGSRSEINKLPFMDAKSGLATYAPSRDDLVRGIAPDELQRFLY